MKFRKWIAIILLSGLLMSACTQAVNQAATSTAPLKKIRLPMGYIPNVQYAPFYVAVEKGFFRQEGIEIEFDYSFETDGVALVGANELQFSVVSGEQVLLARAQGLPVVYVMTWWQEYPIAIVAPTAKGIRQPQDLKGKKIGLPGLFGANYIGLRALLAASGLQESDVRLDSIGFTQVEALLAGQEDAVVVYANNEPVQLRAQGVELDEIRVADYMQLASNGLLSNETTIAKDPELVQSMVRGLVRGIAYTLDHPEEAYEICKKYVDGLAQADQTIQQKILAASLEFWKADRLGYSDALAWENMQQVLLEMGLLTQPMDVSKAFTNQFVEKLK